MNAHTIDHAGEVISEARAVRLRAAGELAVLIFGILAIMWLEPVVAHPMEARALGIGVLVVLLVHFHRRQPAGRRELGLRFDNFTTVLWRLSPYVAGFVGVVTFIGWTSATLQFGPRFWSMLAGVPLWALLQQYLLLAFAHRRFRLLLGFGRRSVLATAALFGLMHLPNPTLTIVCTAGGWLWAREYDRSPNLFAHAVTHAIASAFLANSLPPTLLKNMVVGYHFLVTP
jgi:hypothetical protein